jgi:hypothetical protein
MAHPVVLQFGTSAPAFFLLLVPKQSTQDLATRALRNSVDEANTSLQPLMPSLVLFYVLLDRLCDLLIIVTGRGRFDDYGLGNFTSCLIRDSDDGTISDSRMCEKVSLELRGSNL